MHYSSFYYVGAYATKYSTKIILQSVWRQCGNELHYLSSLPASHIYCGLLVSRQTSGNESHVPLRTLPAAHDDLTTRLCLPSSLNLFSIQVTCCITKRVTALLLLRHSWDFQYKLFTWFTEASLESLLGKWPWMATQANCVDLNSKPWLEDLGVGEAVWRNVFFVWWENTTFCD